MEDMKTPSFLQSLVCFGGVIAVVIFGLLWLGISLHSLLVLALVWVAAHSYWLGFSYQEIKSAMISGIEKGLGASFDRKRKRNLKHPCGAPTTGNR